MINSIFKVTILKSTMIPKNQIGRRKYVYLFVWSFFVSPPRRNVFVHTMNETLHLYVYISMASSSFIVQEVYMETVLFVL